MKEDLKRKEYEHSKKKNKNVEMLKKFLEEKYRLHTKVINLSNKVKEKKNNYNIWLMKILYNWRVL